MSNEVKSALATLNQHRLFQAIWGTALFVAIALMLLGVLFIHEHFQVFYVR